MSGVSWGGADPCSSYYMCSMRGEGRVTDVVLTAYLSGHNGCLFDFMIAI